MEFLISLIILLIIVGVALYLIQLIPMDATIKQAIKVIVIAVVLIYLLLLFLRMGLPGLRLP